MKKKLSIAKLLAFIFALVLMVGCKIEINVPEGGDVVSVSDVYECQSGNTCVVEVNNFNFDDSERALGRAGYSWAGSLVRNTFVETFMKTAN